MFNLASNLVLQSQEINANLRLKIYVGGIFGLRYVFIDLVVPNLMIFRICISEILSTFQTGVSVPGVCCELTMIIVVQVLNGGIYDFRFLSTFSWVSDCWITHNFTLLICIIQQVSSLKI